MQQMAPTPPPMTMPGAATGDAKKKEIEGLTKDLKFIKHEFKFDKAIEEFIEVYAQ